MAGRRTRGNRIISASPPGIAAQHPPRRQHRTTQRAMATQGADRIMAAARLEPASRRQDRPQHQLVAAHQRRKSVSRDHGALSAPEPETPSLAKARRKSSISRVNFRPRVLSRPTRTRSAPTAGVSASNSRAASRSRRRVRLRTTALPTFFVTVKPSRTGASSSRNMACKTRPGDGAFRPLDATLKNSARRVRCGERAPCAATCLGRKLLPALGAAVGDHLAATHRLHAGTETVAALADEFRRLIRTLHEQGAPNGLCEALGPVGGGVIGRQAFSVKYARGKQFFFEKKEPKNFYPSALSGNLVPR